MKQKTKLFNYLFFLSLTFSVVSCNKLETYNVTFMHNDDVFYKTSVKAHDVVFKPLTSPTLDHYKFDDWYTDAFTKYDFKLPVLRDLVLYATFDFDYVDFLKRATSLYPEALSLYTTFYNTSVDEEGTKKIAASGVVIHEDEDNYYALVTRSSIINTLYAKSASLIRDHKGTMYNARLVLNSLSEDYPLAILSFTKVTGVEYKVATLDSKNINVGAPLISISNRYNETHTTLLGEAVRYEKLNISNVLLPDFPLLVHDMDTNAGSTGGGIYNENLELVALEYYSSAAGTYSYAIPVEEISTYLSNHFI